MVGEQRNMPYERDVDATAAEERRAEELAARRREVARVELKDQLRTRDRRGDPPPDTERVGFKVSVGEKVRLERAAKAAGLSVRRLVHAATLAYLERLEGRAL